MVFGVTAVRVKKASNAAVNAMIAPTCSVVIDNPKLIPSAIPA